VDYVINRGTDVIPIEVKSVKTGSLKSLNVFMYEKELSFAMRFNGDLPSLLDVQHSTQWRKCAYKLLSLPHYMVEETERLLIEAL
jgi:hypothetical protein